MSGRKASFWLLAGCALLPVAFALDRPVGQWLFDHNWHDWGAGVMKDTPWAAVAKVPGNYLFTLIVAVLLVALARLPWQRGIVILICGATALVNDPLKWVFGRPRPVEVNPLTRMVHLNSPWEFDFFRSGLRGLADTAGLAFPSGHTMLAFATATCVAVYYPKYAWLCFAVAAVVGAERILEVAHHPSDVVAAALVGSACSLLCLRLLRRWADGPAAQVAGVVGRDGLPAEV